MESLQMWQLILVIITVLGTLLAPTVWFIKSNSARVERETEKVVSRIESSSTISFLDIKEALKEFRTHLDVRLSDVYRSLDSKNIEMKQFVSSELEFLKHHIASIENKLDATRERSHELEKDLLRLQTRIGKDYITKDDLEAIVRRSQNS